MANRLSSSLSGPIAKSLNEAMQSIDGFEFAARLSIASDWRTFVRAARKQPEVQLLAKMLEAPEVQDAIRQRIAAHLAEEVDPAFEHPRDAAIAVYLWLLSFCQPASARFLATKILPMKNLWWGRQFARKLSDLQTQSGTRATAISESALSVGKMYVTNSDVQGCLWSNKEKWHLYLTGNLSQTQQMPGNPKLWKPQ